MIKDIFARGTLLAVLKDWSTDGSGTCAVPATGTLGAGRRALELLFRCPDGRGADLGWRPALLMMGEEDLVHDTGNNAGARSSVRGLADCRPGHLVSLPRTPLALSPVPVPRIAVASFALVRADGDVVYRANPGCTMPFGTEYLGDSECRSYGLPFAGEPCPPTAAVVVRIPDNPHGKPLRRKNIRFGAFASICGYRQHRLNLAGSPDPVGFRVLLPAACCAHLACAVDEGRLEVRSCPDRPGRIERDELLSSVSGEYAAAAADYRRAFRNMAEARDSYREQAAIYRAFGGRPDSVAGLDNKKEDQT